MSLSTCALSGQALHQPVINVKTGHVFEKSLIMKHLQTTAQCPLTGQPLKQSDLVDVNTAKSAAPGLSTQIPQILQQAANCFDQLQLEQAQLRENLVKTRKELSHALYQHDAACHVIATLKKENDELKERLLNSDNRCQELEQRQQQFQLQAQAMREQPQTIDSPMHEECEEPQVVGLSDELKKQMENNAESLISTRKQTKAPSEYTSKKEVAAFKLQASQKMPADIQTVDQYEDTMIVTSMGDSHKVVSNEGQDCFELTKEHTSGAKFLPGQADKIFVAGRQSGVLDLTTGQFLYKVKNHQNVTCFAFQANMETVIVGSDDCSWSLHDIANGQILEVIQTEAPVTAIEFHPDGLVLGIGLSNGHLDLYDIRTLEKASSLEAPVQAPLTALKFSNKGFHMAAAWSNTCRVYSMHKGNTFVDVKLPNEITSIAFDYYGQYFALSSLHEIQIYYFRDFAQPLCTLSEPATSLCFETNSANLIAVHGKQVKFIQASAK